MKRNEIRVSMFLAVAMMVAAAAFGQHNIVLTWTAGAGTSPSGYNAYRATAAGGEGTTPINAAVITPLTYTDTAVSAGTKYFYVLEEIVNGQSSGPSVEVSATVPVYAPTLAKVAISGTTATVTWTASTDSTSAYNIFIGTAAGGEAATPANASPVAAGCSGAACTYTVTGLVPGNSEFVKVQAVINGVSSVASNEASGSVVVPPPTGLTIKAN